MYWANFGKPDWYFIQAWIIQGVHTSLANTGATKLKLCVHKRGCFAVAGMRRTGKKGVCLCKLPPQLLSCSKLRNCIRKLHPDKGVAGLAIAGCWAEDNPQAASGT